MGLYDLFWSERFWLPAPYTWRDLEPRNGVYYPQIGDITVQSLCLSCLLMLIRYFWDRYIAYPLGTYLGVKSKKSVRATPNPVLESAYKNSRRLDAETLKVLEKKTNLSIKEIQFWFRRRRLDDVPLPIQNFQEYSWQFVFYLGAFISGVAIVWDKPWFSDTRLTWKDWPHPISRDVYWFYLVELSFYWSMCFSLLFDIRRKDFLQMIVHHVATVVLIYFSWVCNFVRYGTLVIIVHDAVDYWMAAAKMARYCKKQTLCEIFFGVFIIVWFITRLGFYPFSLLYSVTFEIGDYLAEFPSHRMFQVLLYTLQVLHLIWTYMILKIAVQKFTVGKLEKDARSDTDSDQELEEDDQLNTKDDLKPMTTEPVSQKIGIINGTMTH